MQNETPASPVPAAPVTSQFAQYSLSEPMMRALNSMKFTEPTQIQQKTIPLLIEKRCDIVALAETGSGKTGAYGIPLIEKINADVRETQALILCPTRELAMQVSEQIQKMGQFKKLTVATIYGGASYIPQETALRKGAHVIVATPGRLLDFIEQKKAKLNKIEVLVLDEADEMISLGFKDALEEILKSTGDGAQRWLFSATMNKQIRDIADKYLTDPEQILMKSGELPTTIEQIYYNVKGNKRTEALMRVLQSHNDFYGIVFCQTKMQVDEVSDALTRQGLFVEAFHGDRTQKEREKILKKFRDRTISVLVSTDVAARGLDVKDLTHVVNYNLPWDVESYIHRIGRTGRNGKKGQAISLVGSDQLRKLDLIQKKTGRPFIKKTIPTAEDVLKSKLGATIEKVFSFSPTATEVRMKEIISDVVREKELDLESLSREELISRLITKEMAYWLRAERDDQDFVVVDRDLDRYRGNDRGDSERRGGYRRTNRYERGADRGGDRSERPVRSAGFSSADRERPERSSRPVPRGEGGGERSSGGPGGGYGGGEKKAGGGKKFFRQRRSRD
jgi:ATP-dependent RNA helicase DeaD